jgi:hypothetical protein
MSRIKLTSIVIKASLGFIPGSSHAECSAN